MEFLFIAIALVAALVIFDLLAMRFGTDTRTYERQI
jgi:hypothetical protein